MSQMYKGGLPIPICERCGEPLVRSLVALPLTVTVIYLLMIGALVPLSIPFASKTTAAMGAIGVLEALYLSRVGTRLAFQETFHGYSGRSGHVQYGWLQLSLLLVMLGLCAVSLREESI